MRNALQRLRKHGEYCAVVFSMSGLTRLDILNRDLDKCTLSAWSIAMAVKTITIDMEAYEKLALEKKEGESFSQVIKRILGSRVMTAEKLLANARRLSFTEDTLDRMEEIVKDREADLVGAPHVEDA